MKSKKNLIIIALVMIIGLFGISYAYFRYYMLGNNNHKIVSGDVSLILNDGTNSINLTNVFPETIEEARREGRTDNILTFTISGINTTTNNDIYYEIMLNEGDSEEGKTRYKPEDLLFDLIEVGENNTETYLVEAMNFNDFNARRIWVDSVERNNSLTVNKTYKLRMWLSEDVLISDTDPNADYKASVFKNSYGSIKVSVHGDFNRKTSPYNYMMARHSDFSVMPNNIVSVWPTELEEMVPQFTEVRFMSMDRSLLDLLVEDGAWDLTDTTKSPTGSVIAVPLPDSTGEGYALTIMSDGITMLPENSSGLFYKFQAATQLHFNNINTNNVTNMIGMFGGCLGLTNLNLNTFNTKKVENMLGMFVSCENLVNLDLNSFDTANVTNMSYMFNSCLNLGTLDLTHFNTSKVTDMSWMFNGTDAKEINLSDWDVSNVTNMVNAFEASVLKKVNLSEWYFNDETTSVIKDLYKTEILILSDCDVSTVTDMSELFFRFENLTTIDLSGWDTRNVTNMHKMFGVCSNLTSLNLSTWDTRNVIDMSYMFDCCSGLTSLNLSTWDTRNVANMVGMFASCSSLININLNSWIISNNSDINNLIDNLEEYVTILDLSTWDTSDVTDMSNMFSDCSGLTSLDISNWDTSSVIDMSYMFRGCSGLTSLDISNWDTSSVSNMKSMFDSCSGLMSLDLGNFDTSNVTDMLQMFYNCSSLTSLDISNFTFDSVTSYIFIFYRMKARVDNTPTILVKSETEQKWILNTTNIRPTSWTTENVIVK